MDLFVFLVYHPLSRQTEAFVRRTSHERERLFSRTKSHAETNDIMIIQCRMNLHKPAVLSATGSAWRRDKSRNLVFLASQSELVALERAKRQRPEGYPFFSRLPQHIFHLTDDSRSLESHEKLCKDRFIWRFNRHAGMLFRTSIYNSET